MSTKIDFVLYVTINRLLRHYIEITPNLDGNSTIDTDVGRLGHCGTTESTPIMVAAAVTLYNLCYNYKHYAPAKFLSWRLS